MTGETAGLLARVRAEGAEWRRFRTSLGSSSGLLATLERVQMARFSEGYARLVALDEDTWAQLRDQAPFLLRLLEEWWPGHKTELTMMGPRPRDFVRLPREA